MVSVLFVDLVGFTAVRPGGPGGRPSDAQALPRAGQGRHRALRRDGREVHRRRRDGRLRCAGGPRGRPRARWVGHGSSTRSMSSHRGARGSPCARPSRRVTRWSRSALAPSEVRRIATATSSTPPRDCSRRPRRRRHRRRADPERGAGRDRLRAARADRGEGQVGADSGPGVRRRRARVGQPEAAAQTPFVGRAHESTLLLETLPACERGRYGAARDGGVGSPNREKPPSHRASPSRSTTDPKS